MGRLIGAGSFGMVGRNISLTTFSHFILGSTYAGYDISSGEEVAIKLELHSSSYFHLENETKVYKRLGSKCAAIPQFKWSGLDGEYSVVVLSLLGPSLESLFISKRCTFTLPTVITIAEQLVCQRFTSYPTRCLTYCRFLASSTFMAIILFTEI
jgi:serine/threonine protein kinase